MVTGLFFLSGACALVYEIAWIRMFAVVAGGTTRAMTAVLVAYMSGLALGSFLGGRLVDKRAVRPVLVYGVLEGLIGILALLLTFLIPWLLPVLKAGKSVLGADSLAFDFFRFITSSLVMVIPATLMGATFPVLLRGVLSQRERFGFTAGMLYAANTLGAMSGSLLCGFILIPSLGLIRTIGSAAAVNISIMLIVAAIPLIRELRVDKRVLAGAPAANDERRSLLLWVVLLGYGLSGVCAMVYQVGWARALTLSLGNSTYALSLIFASYIGGLALGGILITPFVDRLEKPLVWAAALEVLIGLCAIAVMPLFEWVTVQMFHWSLSFQDKFSSIQLVMFLVAFGLILAPTMAMGALFPVVVRIAGTLRSGVGEPAGQVYAANTVGAILGSFIAAHVLIRWFGIQNALLAATGVSVFVGVVWLLYSESGKLTRMTAGGIITGAAIVALALFPAWDPILMNSGPYLYAGAMKKDISKDKDIRDILHNYNRVLYYKEGVEATVSVLQNRVSEETFLRINGKTDASNKRDMPTQIISAHLPLLLHPSPKKAMILGLASGVTAGSALLHPLENLDCLEISPAVIEASKIFKQTSRLDYEDPRFNLILDDARNYLALTDVRYDVIMIEQSNPWVAGMSTLFTHEFFSLLGDHLEQDGLVLIWIPVYDMDARTVRMVMRTFGDVFPYSTLWESMPLLDYFVIGSKTPIQVDLEKLNQRAHEPGVSADLARVDVKRGEDLFARFVMGPDAYARAAGDGPLHTDDRRQLEFEVPRIMKEPQEARLQGVQRKVLSHHEPASVIVDSPGENLKTLFKEFDRVRSLYYRVLLNSNPEKDDALTPEYIIQFWRNMLLVCGDNFPRKFAAENLSAILSTRSEYFFKAGNDQRAIEELEEAFELNPENIKAADDLVNYYLNNGKEDLALVWANKALAVMPNDPFALSTLAVLAQKENKFNEAERLFKKALVSMPRSYEYRWNLGLVLAQTGRLSEAEKQFRVLVKAHPKKTDPLELLFRVLKDQGKLAEAGKYKKRLKRLAPDHPMFIQK